MNLLKKAKTFPSSSGVYVFYDASSKPIYVGRAVNLRRRILNYFRPVLDPKTAEMVSLAEKLDYKKTDSLFQAVILEANLIKKYWPKYNIKDKDDRSFVYVVIVDSDFPKPMIVRVRELKKFGFSENKNQTGNKIKIFGPFPNLNLAKKLLTLARRIFPYGICRPNSGKPCFDYQIGLCPGICFGKISSLQYKKNINGLILLLSGKNAVLKNRLKKENPEQAKLLENISDASLIIREDDSSSGRIEAYDISHFSGHESFGAMAVFSGAEPDKSQYRIFKIKEAPKADDLRALSEIIKRRLKHQEWPWPELIVLDGGRPQIDFVLKENSEALKKIPVIGISKFGDDKLVFSKNASSSFRRLAEELKPVLLKSRNEAHRFANYFRKRKKFV